MQKIAISGKGGVGKSTLAAAIALLSARRNIKVLAIDADPDANLAAALGVPDNIQGSIVPISRQKALIEERTGAKVKQYGQIFKLNPEVSDIANSYATLHDGVALLVLGAVEQGGSGCACPENVLIRALIADLVLYKDDLVIMDMEAGVEHLGRATARAVDRMVVVMEPGQRSIDSCSRIVRMAGDIGMKHIQLVGNKIVTKNDEEFIRHAFPDIQFLGMIPYSEEIRASDRTGCSVLDGLDKRVVERFEMITNKLLDS